ncbi:virulence protein RhuM/Fic/DOC family protein [Flavobacterium cyclinae]|uniref:virulence protein RhuM/Fic/DOC family protein n=1 Tax=Flavobacterium cyclinae TaxID=2895947 RepID=UPI001E4FF957|nr:virulence protein RhuM/Fic/DOC family protein [Flavobacterium cyclinae]UGS19862.1 virulence RhuM family protein [Flavobacterium cyclinae]
MKDIVIYKGLNNETQVDILFDNNSLWLNQKQIAQIFGTEVPAINKHIKNIIKDLELQPEATISKMETVQIEGTRKVSRTLDYYNLDMIISIGYRVNSGKATQFRIWATQRLKEYLVKGYALNEKRLKELDYKYTEIQKALQLATKAAHIENLTSSEAKGILKVLEQYAYALETLDKYDHQKLSIEATSKTENVYRLSYEEAIEQIYIWRDFQKAGALFGNEKDQSFKSSLETIYQTFDGEDLYPTIEEKAANLLYFVVKNHSFSDGNKRIAAGLFAYFLDLNHKLLNQEGNKKIADNALVAITIMIAESKPEEKDMMTKLVVNLINDKN